MTWESLIPTSVLYLGAVFLVLSVVLVVVDVPGKGVKWDNIGAVFALLGGFGVGGVAAGWLGRMFYNAAGSVLTNGQKLTVSAVGVGVVGAIVLGLMLWAWSRMRGKGIDAKSKIRSFLAVGALAVVGTLISAIPKLYEWSDHLVAWGGTTLINAINSL